LDDVVRSAEENNVGLIPSFFWAGFAVPDVVGEPVNRWGDPDSQVHAFMKNYVREVVTRYKDSPAIWGWEFGNEYNLPADLPNADEWRPPVIPELGTPTFRTDEDELTHEDIRTAFTVFANEVRKYDPDRIIISGNSIPRPSEWHQEQYLTWEQDTEEQFKEMLQKDNPDPMDTISVHIYDEQEQRFSRTVQVEELINKLVHISKQMKKPLFVGEFGASESLGHEVAKQRFERFLNAIVNERVPLAAVWVFDLANQPENTIRGDNNRVYQLERIQQVNATLHGR
jgi:endo-1,4-beta-mannosidase